MEAYENEQYITFPVTDLQAVQDNSNIISHKEICKTVEEVIVTSNSQDHCNSFIISDVKSQVKVIADQSEADSGKSNYTVYVKEEKSEHHTSGDDESMAVEALRQLGGMYPCFNDKKIVCSNCGNMVESSQLENHQIKCKGIKSACTICGERFEKKIDYNNHMVCHQVDRPHACRTCGNLFRTKSSLQIHMNEAHQGAKMHKCNICGADFQRPSSLSNHMKIHTYVAGRALTQSQNNVTRVVELQASTSVGTTIQDYDVQWAMPVYTFTSDQSNANSLEDQEDIQEFAVMPNGEVAQLEYASQNVSNSLNHQFVTINTFDNSETPVKVDSVQYADDVLKKIVVEVEDDSKTKSMVPIECEYCDKQYQDANHLSMHQKTCIKRIIQASGSEQSGNWGKHACSECGKKFTTKQKMFRHQWIHRKKTHSCEVCGTQFEHQGELDEHRLAAHPGDSPFTCTECGKSFVSRQGLWEHGRTHAGSPAHFHCDKCSKTFSSRQGYLIHHRTHTGERPYGCKFCWKAFRDGGTLRKHERIHTGERPHVCPLCSRAFNQKVVLREHVRWVHAAAKHDTEITGPPFLCPLCGAENQDRDELCAHIVKHSDRMIAEAKAKTNNEPRKTKRRAPKKKLKLDEMEKSPSHDELEASKYKHEQVVLTVAEPIDKVVVNPNVYLDKQNNTYILVNTGKSGKVHFVSDMKEDDDQITRVKGNTFQICIENQNDEDRNDNDVEIMKVQKSQKQTNKLRLIKQNAETSTVLAIPNTETNENFSSHEYNKEQENLDMETNTFDSKIVEVLELQEDSDNSEEMVCGICGEDFNDKNVLMEHVKLHV